MKKTDDKVVIKLFYDGHKYVDDVTVILNGKTYIIKRGVEVSVPLGVKLILDNAAMQQREAQKYMEYMQG